LQPLVLHLITDCFCSLVELNFEYLGSLDGHPVSRLTQFFLQSIRLTPITYSKVAYLNGARSIILFAHAIAEQVAPIAFPMSLGATTTLQLTACSVFSDYLRFNTLEMQGETMTKVLLLILQKTGDSRARNFLEGLNSSCTIQYWIRTMRRILLNNSLLDDSVSDIEPNKAVKVAILHSSFATLRAIADEPVLQTEYLDDFIAAVCRSIEISEVEIQEQAFPVLEKVISLFQDRKSGEGRLLDLYDIQFAVAVRSAFDLNLSVSGAFLSAYLFFATQTDYNPAVLVDYMVGLSGCRQRNASYYALLGRLCVAGRHTSDADLRAFLVKQIPIITRVLLLAMSLRKGDWRTFSGFRTLFANAYGELIPAFVWVCSLPAVPAIDVNALLSFFLIETWTEKENWKFEGALNAIPVIFEHLNSSIDPALLELVIQISVRFRDNPTFANLVESCSKLPALGPTSREFVLGIALQDTFNAKTFAYLLSLDDSRVLAPYAFSIAAHFADVAAPSSLFTILFHHSPSVIGFTIDRLLQLSSAQNSHKLEVLELGLLRFNENGFLPLRVIARFLLSVLKTGGLEILASVLLRRPAIGVALLSEQLAKAVFLLAVADLANARTFLQFVHLLLTVVSQGQMAVAFAQSAFRLAISVIAKFGQDAQRGAGIVETAVQLLTVVRARMPTEFVKLFDETPDAAQRDACGILRTQITKAELRKRNANLTMISTESRKKGDDEWQNLDSDD
jgi:hypothetical protein